MKASPFKPPIYRFGRFTVDTRTGEISSDGIKTQLREQPFQVLLALLEEPGELVTRDDLVRRLWPSGTFVDFDRGLNKAILSLREGLGDSAESPQFVETLPRRGYRFIAPVVFDDEDGEVISALQPQTDGVATRSKWLGRRRLWLTVIAGLCFALAIGFEQRSRIAAWWRPGAQIKAIAVIPLENLSGDPEQQYFADGMTDELITDLSKTVSARVASRTSVMRYKGAKKSAREVGAELDVDAVVEGTVMPAGNRLRITAQLIQTATDMHLWAETYERDAGEVLILQREVATDIARHIGQVVRPLDRPRRVNPDAYGLYLKGRDYFYRYSDGGWQQAIEHFNRAIEIDPEFAPAHSGLADAYIVAGAYGAIPMQEALTRGRSAAVRALELDAGLASAHYALGTVDLWYDWDWSGAQREFERALALDPNDALGRNWHAGYLSLLGRHDEAIDEAARAVELDPLSVIYRANLARAYYWSRRYDEALTEAKGALKIDPKFGIALFWMEGALRHKGMFKEAVALRQAASPDEAGTIGDRFRRGGFASVLRSDGNQFKLDGALLESARCFSAAGDKQMALLLLEECYQRHCSSMVTMRAEPDFDDLHAESRFEELARRVGPR